MEREPSIPTPEHGLSPEEDALLDLVAGVDPQMLDTWLRDLEDCSPLLTKPIDAVPDADIKKVSGDYYKILRSVRQYLKYKRQNLKDITDLEFAEWRRVLETALPLLSTIYDRISFRVQKLREREEREAENARLAPYEQEYGENSLVELYETLVNFLERLPEMDKDWHAALNGDENEREASDSLWNALSEAKNRVAALKRLIANKKGT